MRIGIDARYLSHGTVGGVHTYTKLLIPSLAVSGPEHQFVLYIDKKRPFELSGMLPDNVSIRILPYWGPPSSLINDFFMRQAIARDQLDIMHFPANYGFAPQGVKKIITLHDQINILPWTDIIRGHRKDARTILMMTYLHFCSVQSLRSADQVVTVSEYSRGQILTAAPGLAPSKISAIPFGPAPGLARIMDAGILAEVRRRYKLDKPFILADALKNPAVLARAWAFLPEEIRSTWQIVFFSRRPDPLPVVQEMVQQGIACLLVSPPTKDLVAMYSSAEVFVFPSWIEGLGLPPLEAMTCGCPVIGSNRGSIPEITGGAAWIMDAEDEQTLAVYLEKIYRSPADVETLRQNGYARVANFTWDQVSQRYLEMYRGVLNRD